MICPECGSRDVIEIQQRLPDATEVVFFSCHACEQRWWDHAGERLNLADILELARQGRTG